jgi:diguanylate cyclase (GGDEF)-like protein
LSAGPALALGERIRREVAGSSEGSRVTVSIGVATCDNHASSYDMLFEIADQRLYQAKAAGRNCVIGERVAAASTPVRLAYTG